jgi:hypothetical protein
MELAKTLDRHDQPPGPISQSVNLRAFLAMELVLSKG